MSTLTHISNPLLRRTPWFGVENKIPIVSATQTTRSGYSNTDVGLEDTSESFGLHL